MDTPNAVEIAAWLAAILPTITFAALIAYLNNRFAVLGDFIGLYDRFASDKAKGEVESYFSTIMSAAAGLVIFYVTPVATFLDMSMWEVIVAIALQSPLMQGPRELYVRAKAKLGMEVN